MTDQELDEIEKRLAATLPAPWRAGGEDMMRVFKFLPGGTKAHDDAEIVRCYGVIDTWGKGNASFIAHAREDVPALLAEVRRLRLQLRCRESDVAALNATCIESQAREKALATLLEEDHQECGFEPYGGGNRECLHCPGGEHGRHWGQGEDDCELAQALGWPSDGTYRRPLPED